MRMRQAMWIFPVMAWAVLLSACATMAQGPSYAEARATSPMPGKATVYVFRKHAEPTVWGATIHFDNQEVATLNEGGFTWAYLSPGNHSVRAVWPALSGQRDSRIDLVDIKEGNTYYLELTGIAQLAGVEFGVMYYRMGSGISEAKAEAAELMLSECCKFQSPRSLEY